MLWTLVFFAVPFAAMGVASLFPEGADGLSLANYTQFFANPSYWRSLTNSLEVTLIVTVISILLAYPFAWILAFVVPERWQRLALMLAVLPFWTSYVVRSYSWLLVLAEKGIINDTLLAIGLLSEPIQLANTRAATVIGFVHFFVMLLTLTIFANLKQLSPNYRKAAADLGAGPVQRLHPRHPAADPARHHGRRIPHLRAGDRRLHHAADPGRQQRAADAAADHDADRAARRFRQRLGAVHHPDAGGDASPTWPAPAG